MTSLIKASYNGHLPVAELLIGAKADVNAKAVSKKNSDVSAFISEFRNQFFIRNRLCLLIGSCVFHVLRQCACFAFGSCIGCLIRRMLLALECK